MFHIFQRECLLSAVSISANFAILRLCLKSGFFVCFLRIKWLLLLKLMLISVDSIRAFFFFPPKYRINRGLLLYFFSKHSEDILTALKKFCMTLNYHSEYYFLVSDFSKTKLLQSNLVSWNLCSKMDRLEITKLGCDTLPWLQIVIAG